MNNSPADADAAARRAIREQLERSLIVEAGAGTGKTHSLVDRIESLIAGGKGAIDEIVAITFTRAAAAELRERVRTRLEGLSQNSRTSAAVRERLERAIAGLDGAAIQTIDSFALSLVRERNLEARVPPVVEPMDEIEAGLAFEERWRAWLDRELEGGGLDEPLARAVRLGLGAPLVKLQETATAFHENCRLLEGVRFDAGGQLARTAARSVVRSEGDLKNVFAYADPATAPSVAGKLEYAIGLARRLREAGPDSEESLYLLADAQPVSTNDDRQEAWGKLPDGTWAVKRAKELLRTLQKEIDAELGQARRQAIAPLLEAIARFVREYAEERRRDGRPEFQDLLVWACDLVADADVRATFQARYRYLLIDEFQDTDPLQTELALKLASGPDGRVRPGSLFIVGDPKQSIYRFRHADLSALRRVRNVVDSDPVYLTETRRTHVSLVNWINELFGGWMGRKERQGQPAFVDLESARAPVRVDGPAMGAHFFGEPIDSRIDDVRRQEVRHIVDIALAIGAGEWQVMRRDRHDSMATRRSGFGDLCILVQGRTALVDLERGLEDAGVPYVLEGQSLIFNTQDVRDLVNCLNAIDDPSDEVAIVAALRSPAFGCSDVELYRWAAAGRRFDYLARPPSDGPVGDALGALRRFHDERLVLPVPHLIEKFVRERRLREVALDTARPDERWRLLQAVIEQARALARAGRPSLRELVEWALQRRERAERVTEGAVADLDQDAVRIMTVHYAKGLEFPIVLLTALNVGMNPSRRPVVFEKDPAGEVVGVAVRMQHGFEHGDFERISKAEKEADKDEDVRVLYVAATRAQDHLLVSLYRTAKPRASAAADIAARMPSNSPLWTELPHVAGAAQPPLFHMEGGPRVQLTEAGRDEWSAARRLLLESASRRLTVAATALTADPDVEDVEIAGRTAGEVSFRTRGGTALGRAVHGALQRADLADTDGRVSGASPADGADRSDVTRLARDAATHEGIPQRADEVERLVRGVLASDLVARAAASSRCWREVYVAATVETAGVSAVVEGFIDLVFELPDGRLCIVDYKTDAIDAATSLETASRPHLLQIGAYAAAIERAIGVPVGDAWILFARRAAQGKEAAYRVPDVSDLASAAISAAVRAMAPSPAGTT